jgi:single-strand selective monofunctional uracil DNA glycosylase
MDLHAIARELVADLQDLRFGAPVTHVYNPLVYARRAHAAYIDRFGTRPRQVFMMGMNPGPWGMAQTGVPFGEVGHVRDWLGICEPVDKPDPEHPKRPVTGFECRRSEVSGVRIWGWVKKTFGTPERFFERFFIGNYCPLAFLEESGRNRTPDKLPVTERNALLAACDRALRRTVEFLQPEVVLGVGQFAANRATVALNGIDVRIGSILHPSPANPQANQGWEKVVGLQLKELGVTTG